MEHWIEPQALGDAQRAGYSSPLVPIPGMAPPGVNHYINRPGQLAGDPPLPDMAPPGVRHYINRPGQLSGFADTLKNSPLVHILLGGVAGWFLRGWLKRR